MPWFCTEKDSFYAGPWLTHTKHSTVEGCAKDCKVSSFCKRASWNPSNKACYRSKTNAKLLRNDWSKKDRVIAIGYNCGKSSSGVKSSSRATSTKSGSSSRTKSKKVPWFCTEKDSFYAGPWLTHTKHSTVKGCAKDCKANRLCRMASWNPSDKSCYRSKTTAKLIKKDWSIKNRVIAIRYNCGSVKRRSTPAIRKHQHPCILANTTLAGQYISVSLDTASPEACSSNCSSLEPCLAAAYVPSTQKCYLHSEIQAESTPWAVEHGAITFDFTCTAESHTRKEAQYDEQWMCRHDNAFFSHGTIDTIEGVDDVEECGELCQDHEGCEAITYISETTDCMLHSEEHGAASNTVWAEEKGAFAFVMKNCNEISLPGSKGNRKIPSFD